MAPIRKGWGGGGGGGARRVNIAEDPENFWVVKASKRGPTTKTRQFVTELREVLA